MRIFFLALHQQRPSGVSGGKAPQVVPPPSPKAAPSGVSCSHVDAHSASNISSKLLYKCSYQFMASVLSAPGKEVLAVTLCIHLSFQILGWRFSLCHSSLMGPRKAIDFQFVQFFSCCKYRSDNFQVLFIYSHRSQNQKSWEEIFLTQAFLKIKLSEDLLDLEIIGIEKKWIQNDFHFFILCIFDCNMHYNC